MAKKRKRGKRRSNRHERRQAQHQGGGEWDCIRIPDGLEVFKPEKGETYHIDVVPYIVGAYNKNADEGDEYFELSYAVYNDLGIEEKRYIAIGEMLGKRDPVAEHFASLKRANAEWEDMKQFKPKWRQLMLIFVHEEADKGLQFFEGAYGTFGELLDEEIAGEDEDYIDNFDDPEGGATLEVRFKAQNIGQANPWIKAAKINFEEREDGFDANGDKKLADKLLDQAADICLDDCLKIVDYDTLKAALDGAPVDDDDGGGDTPAEEAPATGRRKRKPKAKPADEDEIPGAETKAKGKGKAKAKKQPTAEELGIAKGMEVEHDEHGECTVIRVAKDGLTVNLMTEEDDVIKGVDPAECTPVEEGADDDSAEEVEDQTTEQESDDTEATDDGGGDDDDWDDDWED